MKAKLRAYLKSLGPDCHQYWPVPTGFGSTTVDVLVCYRAVLRDRVQTPWGA